VNSVNERIVFTGMGMVSPLALECTRHFERLLTGESGVGSLTNAQFQNQHYGLEAKVCGFDRRKMIEHRMLRKLLSPSAAFAVAAGGQALRDGGVAERFDWLGGCGLYVGSVLVDIDPETFLGALKNSLDKKGELDITQFATRGMFTIDPLFLVRALPNAGLCGIAVEHQVLGPNLSLTNGTVGGLQSVILAADALRRGDAQMALAGGCDSLLRLDSIIEHLAAGRLSRRTDDPGQACRPFDLSRDGYALGEGAAFVLLETESHARARCTRVYGELLASGQSSNPAALMGQTPGEESVLDCSAMLAMREAHCDPDEVEVIFGDGVATVQDDLMEARAVQRLFGNRPVSFTVATGSIGFTGSCSGVFSLIHALMGMHRQIIPPMINCHQPDPRCPLHFVREPRPCAFRRALVWNSDRGVKNATVIIGSYAM
jgi:3-oxoacyl-[acyl-carrier-protein] synthase II